MSQALYRKYRSRSLDELVGQEHVTSVLKRAIQTGQLSHAYLLTGPRGVGKTSIARILAHEFNQVAYTDDSTDLDIIEIDAASNRRIDDIRELRERVHIAPSKSRYKVYIIDEVHMLTGESFNALLKTLEEPPAHVIFILATTELDKLPATITSRAQTFHFRRIASDVMIEHLKTIAESEKIAIADDALAAIALHSDGSLRDAETALDQVRHIDGMISRHDVESILGSLSQERVLALLDAVRAYDASGVAATLSALEAEGASPVVVARTLGTLLASQPTSLESLNLLDALLDVAKSSSPSLKLFAVLMRAATAKKTAASMANAPVIREKVAVPVATPKPARSDAPVVDKPVEEAVTPAPLKLEPFDWDALVAHAKQHFVVLHSVLHKCQYAFDGDTLTLYSKFKLHKNKLEDPKYSSMLNQALQQLTGNAPEVAIVFGDKPISDEGLASVAALMGGGVEYKGEEVHAS
jgi:DNA polymerase-3 subunit gamma/tau